MTREEQIEYFKAEPDFLKQEQEDPGFHIMGSRIRYDKKRWPHIHTFTLPVHIKEGGCQSFHVSQHKKSRNYL